MLEKRILILIASIFVSVSRCQASSESLVYFGNGCFWARQKEFIDLVNIYIYILEIITRFDACYYQRLINECLDNSCLTIQNIGKIADC